MSAVLVGWGELHRDVPAALCLLASEHSAGLTGKDSATLSSLTQSKNDRRMKL